MDRSQFTFYESFFRAISRIKKKQDRCDAYDAICQYALYGTKCDLDTLPDAAAIAFELSKPNLDASRKKSSNGKKGGKSKQAGSKPEANGKQEEDAREEELEKELEKELEHECEHPTLFATTGDFAAVASAYLNRINPSASQGSLDELKAFCEEFGPDVCIRAIDVALDAKKATWPYIRAILRRLSSQGVKCLADWDTLEAKRDTQGDKPTYQGKVIAGCRDEFTPRELAAIEKLKREFGGSVDG